MDRLREVNRRGSHSGGGAQISALRRPRSGGFKESAAADDEEVMEDLHSLRLRERPRKEGSGHSAARHKRTRHTSREPHSRIEEVEETEGGEMGASDEDDVPISTNFLPRKPAKLRFHGKVASDEGNAAEIPAVPRKARTAISKRPHESNHADSQRHHSFAPAPPSSSVAAPLFTPSGPASKPMKRMKHIGTKLKAPKHTKVLTSITISEQEVEVAEALFDLARMVSSLGSPLCNNDKMEVKMENGERSHDSIPTPPSSHSAVSSPVRSLAPVMSSCISSSEAPMRKISLLKMKIEDGAHSQSKKDVSGRDMEFKSVLANTGQSVGPKKSADIKITASSDYALTGQGAHHNAAASISVLPVPSQSSQMANINVSVTEHITSVSLKLPLDNTMGADVPSDVDASLLTAFLEQKHEHGKEPNIQDACDTSTFYKEKQLKTSHPCKFEIDLMASPNASASGASEKAGNSLDSTSLGPIQKIQDRTKASCLSNEKHDTQCSVDAPTVKEEIPTSSEKEARISNKLNEEHIKEEKLRENERGKQSLAVSKQDLPGAVNNSNPDLIQQQAADGSGWPGSLPHIGYYPSAAAAAAAAAAVAAAWPASGSVIGAVSMEDKGQPGRQVPPFSFPGTRPLCKRCATHVYIAHFIDTQQQMQRHPIWAATYGNTATGSLYSMKPYNQNASLPPNALFGGGLTGLTGLSVSNSPGIKGLISEPGPQSDKVCAPGLKENGTSLNVDGVARKGASQSPQPSNSDQITPLQAGLGPMFGYPLGGPSSVSAEAGVNNALNKCNSGAGAATAVASCPVSVGASTGASPNTDSVNATAAQVQYLQAMIQQAGFPFTFRPGHLMPPTSGQMTQQQATQFFGNPFYNPPFVHPQQGPATGRVTPKLSSPQGQSTSMHRDVHVSHSASQQQQQQISSASSSQSHQRVASQHLQHFGDREVSLGGETVSSAESKFPGYQKNLHGLEISNMHASNVMSSSSLHSAGMPALPAQVALTAKHVVNAKLPQSCGQGQVQQHSQNGIPYHHSMGNKSIDFQSPQVSSNKPMGVVNKNTVGPGPLGLASVAAVMAPQGHTVLQTTADAQLARLQAYQEQSLQQTYSKFATTANLEGTRSPGGHEMVDNKRAQGKPSVAACTSKMDVESESNKRGCSGSKSGLQLAHMQQNFPGASFNFMTSPVGNSCSRQLAPVSVGCITSAVPSSKPAGVGRANILSNTAATAHESTSLNRSPSSNVSFHAPNVSCHQGIRQGQAASQYSSQTKPVSRMQVGTTGVSTAPSSLLPGSYAGVPIAKQQGYSSKNQQAAVSAMQSRFPPTASGSSSASASPSTSLSKSNSNAAVKNISPGKGSFTSSQKQASGAPSKKPDAIVTHSAGQVVGPTSITVSMGQSQSQQQHSQLHQIQHVIKQQQQQQQWQQQHKQQNLHQEPLQQVPQSVMGVPPTGTLQYHQASGTSQVGQAGVQKQSAQPQHMKQRLYLEQHFYQPQQQQSQSTDPQHSARPGTQQHFAQHHAVSATNRPMQQVSETQHQQAVKHQAVPSHQQPFSLASFGASSSGAILYTSSPISLGNASGGRPSSSDGALVQVTSPKASTSMKPPGGTAASISGSNIQRTNTPSSGFAHSQGVGVKIPDTKLQSQSNSNISYLPYFNTAPFSSSGATVGKSHGASFLHSQGSSVISMRDPSAGTGREDSTSHQFENDRASPASIAPLMTGTSHSSTVTAASNVQASVSQLNTNSRTASPAAPLVPHGLSGSHVASVPGQASQTCTVMSAPMTADSISTTG